MTFEGPANVLICPSPESANIAYKLLQRLAGQNDRADFSMD